MPFSFSDYKSIRQFEESIWEVHGHAWDRYEAERNSQCLMLCVDTLVAINDCERELNRIKPI